MDVLQQDGKNPQQISLYSIGIASPARITHPIISLINSFPKSNKY